MSFNRDDRRTLIATGFGLVAILLWSTLAALAAYLSAVPPFQLVAMSFALSTLVGVFWSAASGERLADLKTVPWRFWLLGFYGLFGYHAAYFFAFQSAPAVEANLINYLWPVLIVAFSTLLPRDLGGTRLRWWHVVGSVLGFSGVAIILLQSAPAHFDARSSAAGYAAALAAALIWSSYSVASRLFAAVPSLAVMVTSAITAMAAAGVSAATETWVWPSGASQMLALAFQGLGPVGLAFYVWDRAMKHGHVRAVGILSYLTPLLSTAMLIVTGGGQASPMLWIAALLITAGAVVGSSDVWARGNSDATGERA